MNSFGADVNLLCFNWLLYIVPCLKIASMLIGRAEPGQLWTYMGFCNMTINLKHCAYMDSMDLFRIS